MERIKKTDNIGPLEGRMLVFGGVYSNLQSLERMREIATELSINASNVICTGDIVGYCAQPEECVQSIKNWGVHSVAGNVEIQLREGENDCGCDFKSGSRCDTFSRQWYPFAQSKLSEDSIEWMKTLPDFIQFQYAGKQGIAVHGSLSETSEYVFKSTEWTKKQVHFDNAKASIVLAGHCGLPFSEKNGSHYWLNAGVIGMPANDGTPRVWYMLLDTTSDNVLQYEHHSFTYAQREAAQLMKDHQLPAEYAHTLETGIWDNCEILPKQETEQQGVAL